MWWHCSKECRLRGKWWCLKSLMRTWAMTSFLRIPAEMMANHSAKIFAFCKIIKFKDCAKVGSLFHLNFIVVYFLFIYFWVVWLNSFWNFSLILFRSFYFTSSVIDFLANDSPLFLKMPLLIYLLRCYSWHCVLQLLFVKYTFQTIFAPYSRQVFYLCFWRSSKFLYIQVSKYLGLVVFTNL